MINSFKFRVWDRVQVKFSSRNFFILQNGELWLKHSNGQWELCSDRRYKAQFYVGLVDTNGKGIYYGDYIRTKDYFIPLSDIRNPTVIGNKHENPDWAEEDRERRYEI